MIMRKPRRLIGLAALVAATISCGDVVRSGSSPVYLVIETMLGIRGAVTPGTPSASLASDVITNVTSPPPCTPATPCPTIFSDSGTVTLRAPLRNLGGGVAPTGPTTNNEVTITRYHVDYIRADGRNTPGVDVPYSFDGATTGTVPANGILNLSFMLVRNAAKEESPLVQLVSSANLISVIGRVTFYGQDRVGNNVNVTGEIFITFGNFGDF